MGILKRFSQADESLHLRDRYSGSGLFLFGQQPAHRFDNAAEVC